MTIQIGHFVETILPQKYNVDMKNEIILYHGSNKVIKVPTVGGGKKHNDYGPGFYCTLDIELAKEWASYTEDGGVVNSYDFNLTGLNVLSLYEDKYNVLNWMAILLKNRIIHFTTPVEKRGFIFILNNFGIDTDSFDVIRGYRADDSYFSFSRAFLGNQITIEQLENTLRLGNLGEQYFIQSPKAFSELKFKSALPVTDGEYYCRRKIRDDGARAAFNRILEENDTTGRYLSDIMRDGL